MRCGLGIQLRLKFKSEVLVWNSTSIAARIGGDRHRAIRRVASRGDDYLRVGRKISRLGFLEMALNRAPFDRKQFSFDRHRGGIVVSLQTAPLPVLNPALPSITKMPGTAVIFAPSVLVFDCSEPQYHPRCLGDCDAAWEFDFDSSPDRR